MTETYLILMVGAIAGILGPLLGGVIIYRNLLKTHLTLRQRVEQELTSLQNDISSVDEKEFLETSAGRDLIKLLNGSVQEIKPEQTTLSSLRLHNYDLLQQIESTKKRLFQSEERFNELTALHNEAQKIVKKLKEENEELHALKATKRIDHISPSQIENELRLALEEVARLQNQLAEANKGIVEAEKGTSVAYYSEKAEVMVSISQELRQPMSSIVGYTDLLLGESVGILGALQRKFVERIKASTERIGSLIDDLIQVTTLETGLDELKPEPVNLDLIIDNAMSYTSSQIREKNISMHLDLPKNVGPIYADREALQQILVHLLQNAGAASRLEGTVHVKVQKKTEDSKEYVLIQVTDTGEGISPEDRARVFTRLYRADNVLIQGVGDTGVGLSIAKTLTEAQKGRIWVDSQLGVGSTFNVLLPVSKSES